MYDPYQAERELLYMFEDSEDSRDHPKMMDVVQGALRAEGFSLSSIRNSDVRHPVDGWFPYLRKKYRARHTNDTASTEGQ